MDRCNRLVSAHYLDMRWWVEKCAIDRGARQEKRAQPIPKSFAEKQLNALYLWAGLDLS